jgi:hypothetical protein
VETKVKPERTKLKRAVRRERWWLFAERAPKLYGTIAGLGRVLATARVSKFLTFSFVPTTIIASEATVIIADSSSAMFAVLQSGLHEAWVLDYQSSLETRGRYTPSDCTETFPFPADPKLLESVGHSYDAHRRAIMLSRSEGVTKIYNAVHDHQETSPDILDLRELMIEMDRAVAAAYGWNDLDFGHDFHKTKQGMRFTISARARQEVLARLLTLNHERYADEVRRGLHERTESRWSRDNEEEAAENLFTDEEQE